MSPEHGEDRRGCVDPDVTKFGPAPYFGWMNSSNHRGYITVPEIGFHEDKGEEGNVKLVRERPERGGGYQ
jgi:hypothetical protein